VPIGCNLCRVDVGAGEPLLQIVCGAPSVVAAARCRVRWSGAELPGGLQIRISKVRGVDSSWHAVLGTGARHQ
jgi:phenylalanyl-tRNA synthetase beta chain